MLPLLPFALGIATGVVAVRLFKSPRSQETLDRVQSGLKDATISGLEKVSNASERMKTRLEEPKTPETEVEPMEKDLSEGVVVTAADSTPTPAPHKE